MYKRKSFWLNKIYTQKGRGIIKNTKNFSCESGVKQKSLRAFASHHHKAKNPSRNESKRIFLLYGGTNGGKVEL